MFDREGARALWEDVARMRVGTRGSALARTQTDLLVTQLRTRFPHIDIVTRVIVTDGDRVQDVAVSQLGDKGVFVRSIEAALLADEIDLAVHSLKDVPSDQEVPGLHLAAYSAREDPRDVLVSNEGGSLDDLPSGSVVGTSSLRRRAQLRAIRPDLDLVDIRGNVDTRLQKLRAGQYDAIVLAAAGLIRLGLEHVITQFLPVDVCTPAAGQGILVVQTRVDDRVEAVVDSLDDPDARLCAFAERSCVRAFGADCRSPIGAYARVEGDRLIIVGMASREDGSRLQRDTVRGALSDPEALGGELGSRLLSAVG